MNDFTQGVYDDWAGCCGAKRQIPYANVILASLIDPANVSAGANVHVTNPTDLTPVLTRLDAMIALLTALVNQTDQLEPNTDQIEALLTAGNTIAQQIATNTTPGAP